MYIGSVAPKFPSCRTVLRRSKGKLMGLTQTTLFPRLVSSLLFLNEMVILLSLTSTSECCLLAAEAYFSHAYLTVHSHSRHKSCTKSSGHGVKRHSLTMRCTYNRFSCHIEHSVRRNSHPRRVRKQHRSFRTTESTFSPSDSWRHRSGLVVSASGLSKTNSSTWVC